VYYTSIASIITPDYFKTCLYHDDQLSGRQRVGRSLKPPLVGVVTVHRALVMTLACYGALEIVSVIIIIIKGSCMWPVATL